MSAAEFDAFMALVPAPVAAHDTIVPLCEDGQLLRASYAVVYDLGTEGAPHDDRYTAPQTADSAATRRYVVRSVGTTPFAARAVNEAIVRGVVPKVIDLPGRRFDPIELAEVSRVMEDDDSSPSLFYIESDYLLRSQPV